MVKSYSKEKYICFDKTVKKFVVIVPYKGKQKNFARYKKLEDAILCRDKYVSEKLK